jgi:hypothetical protein
MIDLPHALLHNSDCSPTAVLLPGTDTRGRSPIQHYHSRLPAPPPAGWNPTYVSEEIVEEEGRRKNNERSKN